MTSCAKYCFQAPRPGLQGCLGALRISSQSRGRTGSPLCVPTPTGMNGIGLNWGCRDDVPDSRSVSSVLVSLLLRGCSSPALSSIPTRPAARPRPMVRWLIQGRAGSPWPASPAPGGAPSALAPLTIIPSTAALTPGPFVAERVAPLDRARRQVTPARASGTSAHSPLPPCSALLLPPRLGRLPGAPPPEPRLLPPPVAARPPRAACWVELPGAVPPALPP